MQCDSVWPPNTRFATNLTHFEEQLSRFGVCHDFRDIFVFVRTKSQTKTFRRSLIGAPLRAQQTDVVTIQLVHGMHAALS